MPASPTGRPTRPAAKLVIDAHRQTQGLTPPIVHAQQVAVADTEAVGIGCGSARRKAAGSAFLAAARADSLFTAEEVVQRHDLPGARRRGRTRRGTSAK